MKSFKVALALVGLFLMASCGSQEDEVEIKDQTESALSAPANLETADSTLQNEEMGTEREGPEKKDLEKKSADFDPAEVKLGNEGK